MKLLDQFFGDLRPTPPGQPPPGWTAPGEPLSPLVSRLWALYAQMRPPHLGEGEVRQLAVLLDPELQGIVNDCAALLRRRAGLGAPIDLDASWLEERLRLAIELERLEPIAEDLAQSAETAIAAILASLGAWNARILLYVQGRVADESRPEPERRRLRDQFRGAISKEEARAELRPGAPRSAARKAEALSARADAARTSQSVLTAMRALRALLGKGGGQP